MRFGTPPVVLVDAGEGDRRPPVDRAAEGAFVSHLFVRLPCHVAVALLPRQRAVLNATPCLHHALYV